MLNKIVLASSNASKLSELKSLLAAYPVEIILQDQLGVPEAEETGLTFIENAIIKARNACLHTGLPAISDDSGLEVDVLDGKPGIYSARYAGDVRTTENYCRRLLEELEGVPANKRKAQFQSVTIFMRHDKDPSPLIGSGTWKGEILTETKGAGGFGYDPIFFIKALNKTAAELSKEEKNQYSHRSQAMQILLKQLQYEYFNK